jgi:hypothetical protein
MRRESVICLMVGFAWTYWNERLFIIRCPSAHSPAIRPLTSFLHLFSQPLIVPPSLVSALCPRPAPTFSSQHLNHRYFFCAPFQLLRASIGPISSRVDCATRRPLRPPEHPNHNSSHNHPTLSFPPTTPASILCLVTAFSSSFPSRTSHYPS